MFHENLETLMHVICTGHMRNIIQTNIKLNLEYNYFPRKYCFYCKMRSILHVQKAKLM